MLVVVKRLVVKSWTLSSKTGIRRPMFDRDLAIAFTPSVKTHMEMSHSGL